MTDQDRDLERRFRQARLDDERRTPSFAKTLAPRRSTGRALWLRVAVPIAAVALVAAGVWRLTVPNVPEPVIAFTPGDMRVPTDYLLDMTNYTRAGEIPRLGASDWFPLSFDVGGGADTRRLP